jgi:hypothetical protein
MNEAGSTRRVLLILNSCKIAILTPSCYNLGRTLFSYIFKFEQNSVDDFLHIISLAIDLGTKVLVESKQFYIIFKI